MSTSWNVYYYLILFYFNLVSAVYVSLVIILLKSYINLIHIGWSLLKRNFNCHISPWNQNIVLTSDIMFCEIKHISLQNSHYCNVEKLLEIMVSLWSEIWPRQVWWYLSLNLIFLIYRPNYLEVLTVDSVLTENILPFLFVFCR